MVVEGGGGCAAGAVDAWPAAALVAPAAFVAALPVPVALGALPLGRPIGGVGACVSGAPCGRLRLVGLAGLHELNCAWRSSVVGGAAVVAIPLADGAALASVALSPAWRS